LHKVFLEILLGHSVHAALALRGIIHRRTMRLRRVLA